MADKSGAVIALEYALIRKDEQVGELDKQISHHQMRIETAQMGLITLQRERADIIDALDQLHPGWDANDGK